jgi:hypothetical protein
MPARIEPKTRLNDCHDGEVRHYNAAVEKFKRRHGRLEKGRWTMSIG